MSVELISVLIAVLAVGANLGGLILTGNRGLRQDMRQAMAQLETRLREDISQLRGDMKPRCCTNPVGSRTDPSPV